MSALIGVTLVIRLFCPSFEMSSNFSANFSPTSTKKSFERSAFSGSDVITFQSWFNSAVTPSLFMFCLFSCLTVSQNSFDDEDLVNFSFQ